MSLGQQPLPSTPPRVVIVDADRRVLQSLTDLLSVAGEISVVGGASDVRSALEAVEAAQPDAVFVDPRLPDVDAGMAMVAGMRRAWPRMRIVLTGWGDVTGHAMGDPRVCYVSKSASPEEFASSIVDACAAC